MNDTIPSEIAALFSAGEYKTITDKYLSYAAKADSDLLRVIAQAAYLSSDILTAKNLLQASEFKDNPGLWHDLAFYQSKLNELEAAEISITNSIKLRPDYAASQLLAGNIFKALNKLDAAINAFGKASELGEPTAFNNLATTLVRAGLYTEAEAVYLKAPPSLNTDYNYANLLEMCGDNIKALSLYREIVRNNPAFHAAWNNLGQTLQNSGELAEAQKCFETALSIKPDLTEAKLNKAKLLVLKGQAEEARQLFKEIADSDSALSVMAQINLCYVSNFSDKISAKELADEHRKLHSRIKASGFNIKSRANKKIKLGYISADFRMHSVAYFIEGLLRTHDKSKFEVHLYANQIVSDQMTDRIKAHADSWLNVKHMSDSELLEKIRSDRIDILIDLSGLTNGNRAIALAERAAPVQINYLGYPHSSGIPNIDYRIVDSITDPDKSLATEKLIYIEPCFICYQADSRPEIKESNKPFTFGSFNALAKLSDSTLACWAEILKKAPDSSLLLKSYGLSDPDTKRIILERFAKLGIAASRLILTDFKANKSEHFDLYNSISLALDSFPYGGTTTTCEALSMNVPVLTLSGDRHSARVGHSILSAAGLAELVCKKPQEYIQKAVSLASDPQGLKHLKQKLSDNFENSDLCDQQKFTNKWESLLMQLFKQESLT